MSRGELELPLSKCSECPLHQGPTFDPHASYQGNLDSPEVLFIGEAVQGINPMTKKENLGNIGRLLKRETHKVGIEDWGYANLVACQNEGENKWGKKVNKKPSSTHIKCCAPNIQAIIEQINPKVIVTLGATPTKKMGIKGKFVGNRGVLQEGKYGKVLPILHPNSVLMKPNFLDDFRQDLSVVKDFLDGEYTEKKPDGKYILIKTKKEVKKLLKTLKVSESYSFDIEATGLYFFRDDILGVGFCPKEGLAFYLPLTHKPNGPKTELMDYWGEDQEWVKDQLRKMLTLDCKKIAHNGKYDIKMLQYQLDIEIPNFWFDTMLAHYLMDENRGHGLKDITSTYFPDYKNYDAELHDYISMSKQDDGDFGDAPIEVLAEYCAIDCDMTVRLHKIFLEEMDEKQKKYLFKFYIPLSKVYIASELNGIQVDVPYVEKLTKEYEEKEQELLTAMYEIVGHEFNPNSPRQMAVILFEEMGFEVLVKTASGNPSTAEGVLKELPHDHENYKLIELLLEYRTVAKMLSTYFYSVLEKVDEEGRLHPSFLLHGTVTGRLSSKRPNIQNIPRDPRLRGMFIPSKDHNFVSIDYSQVELRVMAFYSKDKVMTQAYVNGEDLHTTMAAAIYKLEKEDVDPAKRKRAKMVNFGYVYGAQPNRAMESINEAANSEDEKITITEAKKLRRVFFGLYRGVERFIKTVHKLIHKQGYVESVFGRKRRLPQVRSPLRDKVKEAEREGLNAIVQGTASDITQISAIRAHKLLLDYKSNVLFTVHDEINFDIHKDEMFLIDEIKALMEEPPEGFDFPLIADVEIYKERWKNQ